jgi:hypothetical protein
MSQTLSSTLPRFYLCRLKQSVVDASKAIVHGGGPEPQGPGQGPPGQPRRPGPPQYMQGQGRMNDPGTMVSA